MVDAVAFTVVVDVANIPGTQAYSSPTSGVETSMHTPPQHIFGSLVEVNQAI